MANILKDFSFMEFPLSISRQNAFPLDRNSVFYSQQDAETYATTNATSYVGQPIAVVDEEEEIVNFYVIGFDGTLNEVGAKVVVDGKTIKNENGTISLYGFEAVTKAGMQVRSVSDGTGGFRLEWFEPSGTTIEDVAARVDTLETEMDSVESDITALEAAVGNKVDKVDGKGLSTNDYTNEEKQKLAGIAAGAEVNVQADWNESDTGSDAYIKNKPTSLPANGGNADTVGGKTVDDTQTTSDYLWTAEKIKSYADSVVAANDAMVYKGTVSSTSPLPATDYKTGWSYKVAEAGTYASSSCEVGDLIIALNDYASGTASDADWQVIQGNVDGAVTSAETSSSDGTIAVFDGTSGKVIRQGTKKISDLEYTLPQAGTNVLGGVKAISQEAASSTIDAGRKVNIHSDGVIAVSDKVILSTDTFIINGGTAAD